MANATANLIENTVTETSAQEADTETTSTKIDSIDGFTGKQLDELVKEHEIEVPETWGKMKVADKKTWLNDKFKTPDEPAAEAAEAVAETPPVAEPAPAAEVAAEPAPAAAAATTTAKASRKKAEAAPAAAAATGTDALAVAGKKTTGKQPKPGDDKLVDLIAEIEHLTEDQAKKAVAQCSADSEFQTLKLGGVLSRIQAKNWFAPYASFRECIEKEFDLSYRSAMYYVQIYNDLAQSGVAWKKVASIGWSKLKEISSVLTKDNVDKWVKIAEKETTIQLHETVKAHKLSQKGQAPNGDSITLTTKTFKVHDDQKKTINAALDKAKAGQPTVADTTALEAICVDYLGSATMVQRLQQIGPEAALKALEEAFPDIELTATIPGLEGEDETETAGAEA